MDELNKNNKKRAYLKQNEEAADLINKTGSRAPEEEKIEEVSDKLIGDDLEIKQAAEPDELTKEEGAKKQPPVY